MMVWTLSFFIPGWSVAAMNAIRAGNSLLIGEALISLVLILAPPGVDLAHEPYHRVQLFTLSVDTQSEMGPQPPCGAEVIPSYPRIDDSATVKSWSQMPYGGDWRPPTCTGWTVAGFTTLVTTVARFRYFTEAESLLRRFGAISGLAGIRYWSTTHKQWRTLVVDAYGLTTSKSGKRRNDFTPDEMKEGNVLYFEQTDNISGKAIYRMHVAKVSTDRIVIDVENVSTLRYLFIPIAHPGEMQAIYFLDRESSDVWRYYSMVRTGKMANRLIAANESSAVNRAVAFYRYLVGIPTDQEPPAAR